MAVFNKFNDLAEQIGLGIHDFAAAGHTLKVVLTNTAPVATNTILADITQIANGNGYTTGGEDIQNDWSENPTGTGELTGVDVVWTATGSMGPFQYVVLYNDTPTSPVDPLIGWWDYGSAVTLNTSETFTVDFGTNILTIA